MDRGLVFPGSVPLDTDILYAQRSALIGLGYLALDLLGAGPLVFGLTVVPSIPAALTVKVNPGRLYALENIDGSAYGSLLADTAHQIVKQGILSDAVTLSCPAPTSSGQSINYLIEAIYQDTDATPVVLQYFNSTPPNTPFSGPGNSGAPQNTQRLGQVILQAKAGIPATTGTQTTPAADSGYTGLYVVTVAFGATTINSGNINQVIGAPYSTPIGETFGVFTPGWTGFSAAPTGTITWSKVGTRVCLKAESALIGISNANTFTMTGLPSNLSPSYGVGIANHGIEDNGATLLGVVNIAPNASALQFSLSVVSGSVIADSSTAFTTSGNKGLAEGWSIIYDVI